MPKFDIILKPGEKVPEEFKQLLNDKFGEQHLDKLKRFGGRIQLSLTAPFTDRKEQKKKIIIDNSFVKQITSSRKKADENLGKMTSKQIRELASFVNFPIASKTTVEEARRQLISYLFSSDTWKKISK
jgi:uncharacterized protein YicC (UPF0701 family)